MSGTPCHPLRAVLPHTVSGWAELLRAALQLPAWQVYYPDHFYLQCCRTGARVLAQQRVYGQEPAGRPSAVLLLLAPTTDDANAVHELSLAVTERTMRVSSHKGQMSFPGGRVDRDESAQQAAQRETLEETGLPPSCYTVLGQLTPVGTHRGAALVTPIVALASRPVRLTCASVAEVASIHYLHLCHLLLHGAESQGRVIMHRSLSSAEPHYFPAFFASSSPSTPSPALRPSPQAVRVVEDGTFVPMLPHDFPGKLVWGVTAFITCELLARVAMALELRHPALSAARARELLRCSDVLARDPEATTDAP